MTTGSINYSPDYKSEKAGTKIAILDAKNSAALLEALERNEAAEVRARLEREVIDRAKAYGRANQAVEDHMKTSTEAQSDPADGWQQLRDLESTWEEMLLEAIKPLLDFESSQQQIKK